MAQGVAGTGPNANPDLKKVVGGRKTKLTRADILKLAKAGGRSGKKKAPKKAKTAKKATKKAAATKPASKASE